MENRLTSRVTCPRKKETSVTRKVDGGKNGGEWAEGPAYPTQDPCDVEEIATFQFMAQS